MLTSYTASTRLAALMLAALSLGACSRSADTGPQPKPADASTSTAATAPPAPGATATPAVAPTPPTRDKQHDAEWMQAIFGTAYNASSEQALVTVKDNGENAWVQMTLAAWTDLPDGRTVVITNGAPSNEKGEDQSSHAASGLVNVYLLQRKDKGWTVLERHDNVAALGSDGRFSEVKWVSLGGKPGFIVSSGGVWQGYVISLADVFVLERGVRHLGSIKEASGNSGACGPGVDCWDVASSIRFADAAADGAAADNYPDMLVEFTGKRYRLVEDKDKAVTEHATGKIQESARYRFNGKEYALVSGSNPVPDV